MSTPLLDPTNSLESRERVDDILRQSTWDKLNDLSPIERARYVRTLSTDEKNLLSPRNIFGMRGLSSPYSSTTRIKQLFFAVGNIANAAIGSGILAFPRAYFLSGWAFGLFLTFTAVLLNTYTLLIVLRTARYAGCNSYPATISKLYGVKARRAIELSVFVFSLSCNLSYLLVVGDMVSATFRAIFHSTSVWISPYPVTIIGWLLITPLCFFKSLDFLGPVSIIGVVAVVVVAVVLVSTSLQSTVKPPFDSLVAFNFQPVSENGHHMYYIYVKGHLLTLFCSLFLFTFLFFLFVEQQCAIQSLPIIFFALMCHLTIVPCGIELGEYWPSLRSSSSSSSETNNDSNNSNDTYNDNNDDQETKNASMENGMGDNTPLIKPRFRTLIVMTTMVMCLCWLLYSAVGTSGYVLFGLSTKANVINSFGENIVGGSGKEPITTMVVVSQVCMALSTLLGYPTMLYIARQTLFELVGEMKHGSTSYIVTTVSMQTSMLILALVIRWAGLDISFVISLIGSTAGATLQFILPACMLYTLNMPYKGCVFMVFGILFAILGTSMTILSAVCDTDIKSQPRWCSTLGF